MLHLGPRLECEMCKVGEGSLEFVSWSSCHHTGTNSTILEIHCVFQLILESWCHRMGQAAKKKDKAGEGAEAEKPKPVAFGCEAGSKSFIRS